MNLAVRKFFGLKKCPRRSRVRVKWSFECTRSALTRSRLTFVRELMRKSRHCLTRQATMVLAWLSEWERM